MVHILTLCWLRGSAAATKACRESLALIRSKCITVCFFSAVACLLILGLSHYGIFSWSRSQSESQWRVAVATFPVLGVEANKSFSESKSGNENGRHAVTPKSKSHDKASSRDTQLYDIPVTHNARGQQSQSAGPNHSYESHTASIGNCQTLSQAVGSRVMWKETQHWSHPTEVWNSCGTPNKPEPSSCFHLKDVAKKFVQCRHRFLLVLRWTTILGVNTFAKSRHDLLPFHCCLKTGVTWLMTGNRSRLADADIVEFHGGEMRSLPKRGKKDQLYLLFFMEAYRWKNFAIERQLSEVNLVRSYNFHGDLYHSYGPEPGCWKSSVAFFRWKHKLVPFSKRVPMAMATLYSHCSTFNNRSGVILSLSRHLEVHNFGKCFHNRDLPKNEVTWNETPYSLGRYKLALAMENSLCTDYITEKFMRYLLLGVIPVVSTWRGRPDYSKRSPNNHSFVDLSNFGSASDAAVFLKHLMSDEAVFNSFSITPLLQTNSTTADMSEHFRTFWHSPQPDPECWCPLAEKIIDTKQRELLARRKPPIDSACAPPTVQWNKDTNF